MTLQNILEKTEEYLQVPSVVRFEQPFMKHLIDDFIRGNNQVEIQNRLLIVSKKYSKNPKVVTCHIDRHGIVVNQDGQFEYAAFNAKKHYGDENVSSEAIFEKSGQRFIDELVYAYDPSDGSVLGEGKVKDFSYDFDKKDLLFEIDGLTGLPERTPVAYRSPLEIKDGKVSSQLDNAISAAVLYQLVQDGYDGKIIFSTEEEIGKSWQHVVNYLKNSRIRSQELINIDTTPYDDERAIQEGLVVLRNKDENGVFNPDLVGSLKQACEDNQIRYEIKDEVIEAHNVQHPEKPKKLGKTELGRIVQHTDGQFNGATVQIPTTGTNHETTSEQAVENYYTALTKLL